ncbi:MAG: hypothetical protein KOO66_02220 [Bacteroidales bacterium]|nr:hypothetical protein [Bacteroidales bacterium]
MRKFCNILFLFGIIVFMAFSCEKEEIETEPALIDFANNGTFVTRYSGTFT